MHQDNSSHYMVFTSEILFADDTRIFGVNTHMNKLLHAIEGIVHTTG